MLPGEEEPWFGRGLQRIVGQAGFAWGGVSPVLLYLIELESLDLSGALDFILPLGFLPQPAFLKMLLWVCFLSSSSNHEPCPGLH